jgi:hypothetical protein
VGRRGLDLDREPGVWREQSGGDNEYGIALVLAPRDHTAQNLYYFYLEVYTQPKEVDCLVKLEMKKRAA